MPDAPSISPRGIPPIRTDWLADVAWRLAALGLGYLRTVDAEHLSVVDLIDGERWRVEPILFGTPEEGVVEMDGDVFLPTDEFLKASLRMGVELTPLYENERGALVQVRIEIGPRGPVTFDPENWIYTFPLADLEAGNRPSVTGVEPGEFKPEAERYPVSRPGSETDLEAGAVMLGDLVELAEGRRTWTTVVGFLPRPPKRRLFGLVGPGRIEPSATLTIVSDGELRITPAAPLTGADFSEIQPLDRVEIAGDRITLHLSDSPIPGGQLTIAGTGLRTTIHRITEL